MSIKQKLLEAANSINAPIELDSIFESADLSADLKAKVATVFESVVKARAVALAETHINEIVAKSEELVESRVQEEISELTETLNTYLDHVAKHWLEENAMSVNNSIKVDMFESLMVGMKDLFVDHNVIIPEEAVNVVEELEAEIAESREELNVALNEKALMEKQMNDMKRDGIVESSIASLTESQKEKVKTLIEGVEYNDKFETKLSAIVEMTAAKVVTEAVVVQEEVTTIAEEAGANFVEEQQIEESTTASVDPRMAAYLAAL